MLSISLKGKKVDFCQRHPQWNPLSRKRPQDTGSVLKLTAARANLRAAGWRDNGDRKATAGGASDFEKPVVTIGMPYNNSMPCNNKFLELAQIIAAEIERQGGKPHIAGTPVIRCTVDSPNGAYGHRILGVIDPLPPLLLQNLY